MTTLTGAQVETDLDNIARLLNRIGIKTDIAGLLMTVTTDNFFAKRACVRAVKGCGDKFTVYISYEGGNKSCTGTAQHIAEKVCGVLMNQGT